MADSWHRRRKLDDEIDDLTKDIGRIHGVNALFKTLESEEKELEALESSWISSKFFFYSE